MAFFPLHAPPSFFVLGSVTEPEAVTSASQSAFGLQEPFSCLASLEDWATCQHAQSLTWVAEV